MKICYNLDHVFGSGSSDVENAYVLRALLDCLIEIDLAFLRFHEVPRLYRSGVRYGRTKLWEPIPEMYERRFGDCKSLSAALCAEYRVRGIQAFPVFRFIKNDIGGHDYHILVELPMRNGITGKRFEDPSRKLGMNPAILRKFYDEGEAPVF